MNEKYKNKYLKYKNKYLKIKSGGALDLSRSSEIETLNNSGYISDKIGNKYSNQCFFISILHYLKLNNLVPHNFDIYDLKEIGGLDLSTRDMDFGTENDNFYDVVTRICERFNVGVDVYLDRRAGVEFDPRAFNQDTGLGIQVMPGKRNRISIIHLGRHFQLIVKYDRVGIDLTTIPRFNNIVTDKLKTYKQNFQPISRIVNPNLYKDTDTLLLKDTSFDIQSLLDQNEIIKLKLKQVDSKSEESVIFSSIIDENERMINVILEDSTTDKETKHNKSDSDSKVDYENSSGLEILFIRKSSLEEIKELFEEIENIDLKLNKTHKKATEFEHLYKLFIIIKPMNDGDPNKNKLIADFVKYEKDNRFFYDGDEHFNQLVHLYDQKNRIKDITRGTEYRNKSEVQQELDKVIEQIRNALE